ncbi:MAG: armadillo-type protein [Benjaminiella poitrasii]|nr:MAG: armadillo-type protein [Benjaminiella poitrasii]
MSQQDERVAYFTSLCEQLYNPKSPEERLQVQKVLEQSFPTFTDTNGLLPDNTATAIHSFDIHSPTDTASALRILLESSPNPYVQIFALGRLKQLVQAQFALFNQESKIQLRSFLLQYAFMHPDLVPFVITHLATVLASLTLLGWAEIEQYRNVHKDILQFIQASVDHRIVGMQILAIMVQDINPPSFTRSASKFRKAAGEFRDTQLLDICETAYKTLEALVVQHSITTNSQQQEQRLQEVTLNLLTKCFSYDFNGTSVDESGEDVGILQIPASWRSFLENPEFLNTLFKAYDEFQPPYSSKVMECLVQVASVRKTLFNDQEERSRFVMRIMQGIRNIILTSRGLNDADSYNSFCRLLFRFRASVPLNEMVEKPGYMDWIELIADFSLKAFQSWKFTPTTSMYVLGFWARIVQSMTYYQQLGTAVVEKLGRITIELIRSYISTSVESVPTRIEEGLDDPLDNEESLIETLNMLGQIAHCKYEASSTAMISLFDPITVQYQELVMTIQQQMANNNTEGLKEALEVIETKFAWFVYIMASFIGNRSAFLNSVDLDKIDSEITTKVLQLMNVQQNLQSQHGNAFMNEKLDLGFIYFFQQFKKSYMSESNGRDIYSKLSKVFGVSDQIMMLDVIMRKIVSNLQSWGNNELLVQRTLELFNELAAGYGASKNLRKIETTRLILQNHMATEFAFCQSTNNKRQDENRILYFQVLCKLLFADDNVDERAFYEFMKPFDIRFSNLGPLDSIEAFRTESTRRALRDIFVDLCGFISPLQTRRHFILFFEWFYEGDYSSILLRAIEAWSPDPIVNSLLLFFVEFVHNKSQRLSFEVSSPNGILMFRDASQIICSFGQQMLNKQQQDMSIMENDVYDLKYKGIAACFNIMSKCLGGRYINFGVLWLYQDKAIEDALSMMIKLMLSIPMDDLLSFPKLSTAFFNFLDELTREELMAMPNIPSDAFVYIMQASEQGVESSDSVIRGHACTAIYNICSYLIKEAEKAEREKETTSPSTTTTISTPSIHIRRRSSIAGAHWLTAYIHHQYPQTLPTLMFTVFNLVLFDDNSDQWTLSRPLYGLVFLQRDYMVKYINAVIEQQLPERRAFVTTVNRISI